MNVPSLMRQDFSNKRSNGNSVLYTNRYMTDEGRKLRNIQLFTKREILDQSKFEVLADDKINATKNLNLFFGGNGRKHFGKKEKMLVTSVFSFSQNVFKSFLPQFW